MIRIGTRASALALAQAESVAAQLPDAVLVEITVPGDRGERLADKARWVSELEQALLDARIDLAVHSAKDVPGELAPGTEIVAIPVREDPRDALVGAPALQMLRRGARVGTSSLRRGAQLRAVREDLEIVELRGNIDTRLRRRSEGDFDAIVLASAGLNRLGREQEIGAHLDEFIPAPGQGALIIQGVPGSDAAVAAAALVNLPAQAAVLAERQFARVLGASCNTPVGACGMQVGDGAVADGEVDLRGWVGLPDGSEWIADQVTGRFDQVGEVLAERMSSVGARTLVARAEAMVGA